MYVVVGYWPAGKAACLIWLTLDHVLVTVSNVSLLAIALDRYLSICQPIYYRKTFRPVYIKRILVSSWFISVIIWMPAILVYPARYGFGPENEYSVTFYQKDMILTSVVVLFNYVLPVLILVCIYYVVSKEIIKRTVRNTEAADKPAYFNSVFITDITSAIKISDSNEIGNVSSNLSLNCSVVSPIYNKLRSITGLSDSSDTQLSSSTGEHSRCIDQSSKKNPIRLLLLVTLSFTVVWMPYNVSILLRSLEMYIPEEVWDICYVFGWLNSLINPICYAYGNNVFKKGFTMSILYRKKKQPRS